MFRAIDFHTHILPEVDDGSSGIRESLGMLQLEAEQGIDTVIATPHFYAHHDNPEGFLARRNRAAEQLLGAMEAYPELPQLILGAEVYYFPGMSDSGVLTQLTIGGRKCILIEMPPPPWTPQMYRELEGIYTKQQLIPVIAHVDRYIRPLRTYGIPKALEELPVLVQANAGFFLQKTTAAFALRLLREDRIHLMGSDCHNLTDRAPNLGDALQFITARLGSECLDRIGGYQYQIETGYSI